MELTDEDWKSFEKLTVDEPSAVFRAGVIAGMERAAKICEQQTNRDEPLWHEEDCANWSLGEVARAIREAATEGGVSEQTQVVSRRLTPTDASPSLEEKLRVLLELKDRALRESQSGMADSRGMDRLTAATLQAIIDDISEGG